MPRGWFLAATGVKPLPIEGFVEVVSSANLIDGTELAALCGLTSGTPHNNDAGWLKFIDGGVVKYIAKMTLRYNAITPTILDAQNLRSGKIITIRGLQYRVRCISGSNSINANYPDGNSYNPPGFGTTEWARLMYPFIQGNPSGKTWHQTFTLSELGITGVSQPGAYTLLKEVRDATYWTLVGQSAIDRVHAGNASGAPQLRGWRPLLEPI